MANALSFLIPSSEKSIAVTLELFFAKKKESLPSPQPKSKMFAFLGRCWIVSTTLSFSDLIDGSLESEICRFGIFFIIS